MPIRGLSPALLKKAQDELGEVPSRLPEDLKAIKDWLAKQPYINANLDDQWLIAFLRGCKYSLERTKERLDNYYTARTLAPEIIMAADPANKDFLEFFRLGSCVALKKPISEDGVHVVIFRPGLIDPDKYKIHQNLQVSHMINEILMLESDNVTIAGMRMLGDMRNMTMGHLAQLSPTTMKKMAMCGEKATPIRQKGAHHLNAPSWIDTVFNMLKNFISEKLQGRIYIHGQDDEELYKHIPKECLPTEYGGDAGPIQDLIDYWEKKILAHRDYFLESRKFKTDESKRPGKPKTAEGLFGVEGSFRSLNVD